MAFDGSGTFNRPVSDYVYDTVISETSVNTEMAGMATGLSNTITKDGQTTISANIPFNSKKITGLTVGSAATDSAHLGQVQAQAYIWCGTMTGTADAGVLTPSPAITAYAAGQHFRWVSSANTNTTAMTVAISGLATKAVEINDSALAAGEHAASKMYEGVYDGTAFQIQRISPSLAAAEVTVADESSDTTSFPLFVTAATGDLAPKSGSNLTFNSSTGSLGATEFVGGGAGITGLASGAVNPNLIINGGMTVSQRGTSFAAPTSLDYTLDRWLFTKNTGAGVVTITQDTASAPTGYSHCLKVDCTTINSSPASGDRHTVQQKIEAQNMQHLKWGDAAAETLQCTFQVSSPKTGTHCVALYSVDGGRSNAVEYTVAVADTWEEITVEFAGDTGGTINNDTGDGMALVFPLVIGTATHVTTANTWESGQLFSTSNQQNLLDNTANNFLITGVKLEVGSSATDFVHESYGDTLAKCQRYLPAFIAVGADDDIGHGVNYSTSAFQGLFIYKVTPRVQPTGITVSSASHFRSYSPTNGYGANFTSVTFAGASDHACTISGTGASGMTTNDGAWMRSSSTSATIFFTGCEL